MGRITRLTVADQVAETLREGLREGRWGDKLPGMRRLAAELGVAKATLVKAVRVLEGEGLLDKNEGGESRSVVQAGSGSLIHRQLRVAVLIFNTQLSGSHVLKSMIQAAGHDCVMMTPATKAMLSGTKAIARFVHDNPADAWVICGGSEEACQWFAASGLPVLGLGGLASKRMPTAVGYLVNDAMEELLSHLLQAGHRRIVMLDHEINRHSTDALYKKKFLEVLHAAGVATGEFNLPQWKETPGDFLRMLETLFRFTPPTAIICMIDLYAGGVIEFLGRRNLKFPQDVSILCIQPEPALNWQMLDRDMAHFIVDYDAIYKRVVHWLEGVHMGRPEAFRWFSQATIHWGDTIGPLSKERK